MRITTIGVVVFNTKDNDFHAAKAEAKKVTMDTNWTMSNLLLLKRELTASSCVIEVVLSEWIVLSTMMVVQYNPSVDSFKGFQGYIHSCIDLCLDRGIP